MVVNRLVCWISKIWKLSMKKLFLTLIILPVVFSCKKKNDSPAETPTNNPTNNTPAALVQVNGANFTYDVTSAYFVNPTRAVNFVNNSTSEQVTIKFLSAPTTGTFSLVKYGSPSVQYFKNNNVHNSINGTLIVNAVTSNTSNVITKLNCTFNCQTDTNSTSSTYFSLTNGVVDYNQ